MKKMIVLSLLVCGLLAGIATEAMSQQKLAQTGMKFLSVGTDARAMAMGEAFTAVEGTSTSMFFNPAGMARLRGFTSLSLGFFEYLADINHYYGSVAFAPSNGDYGVFGVSVQYVDYGEFEGTIRDNNPNGKGYFDAGDIPGLNFHPNGFAVGVGYARALSDKFSLGGNIKYVQQNLGDAVIGYDPASGGESVVSNTTNVLAFDFGVLYRTGFKSLNFGMAIRNFSREARYQDEGFQLPLIFKIGFSMDVLDLTSLEKDMHRFLLSADWVHPRDYSEQIMLGAEYTFMKLVSFRIGYVSPADEHGMSYGVGVKPEVAGLGFALDYAYTPFGVFGSVNRFTFQFEM